MVLVTPHDNLILFKTLSDKLNKLYEWGLIPKTHVDKILSEKYKLKTFKYYYTGNDKKFDECDIVGFIPYTKGKGETAVVSVKSSLCKVMPLYLKDMQSPNFESSLSAEEGEEDSL